MRTQQIIFFLLTLITSIHALTLPQSFQEASHLFKRKGGGGGGGRGGGSSSSSSSSSSSGSSSGGSRGSGSSSSSGGSRGGVAGVGPQPVRYGGGSYYGGGAARPFPASGRTPGGLNGRLLPAAGVGFLGAGALAYGAYYFYPYHGYYAYHNNTADRNETHPAQCYCGEGASCGCEQNNDTEYMNSVANNQTISRVADVNGTDTLLINGSLPAGTTAEEAATNKAAAMQVGGWVVISGAVTWAVWLL